ncbi:MAG: PorV/PorQ family protein [Flavobacteriales bacterium]|nr:PorV/PorQ family protein [Flavobacteriales bacterium]
MQAVAHIRILVSVCLILAGSAVNAQLLPNFGGQRAGLSTLGFLKNDMNSRSAGMSGAGVALDGDYLSVSSNPAALTAINEFGFGAAHLLLGAGIHQSLLSVQGKLKSEATLGLSMNSLNSGAMPYRTEFQPDGTGNYFYVGQHALGVNYAQKLSEQFNLGVTLKYIFEQMAEYRNHMLAFDVGFLYETDFRDMKFAVLVQNFGGNSAARGDYYAVDFNRDPEAALSRYTIPTVFKMGLSFKAWEQGNRHLLVAAELNNPNDNAENIRIGTEFAYRDLLQVQGGVKLSVKGQTLPTFGFRYKSRIGVHPIHFGYAMNPANFLGTQHLFTLQFTRNRSTR